VLVVIAGLPAVGKSTIAALLGAETSTPYLRVDRIEQAIVESSALSHPLGPAGYAVAQALADEQLRLGLDVIVECVNPLSLAMPGCAQPLQLALASSRLRWSAPTRPSIGGVSRSAHPMSTG
jgi:hypothetical protein